PIGVNPILAKNAGNVRHVSHAGCDPKTTLFGTRLTRPEEAARGGQYDSKGGKSFLPHVPSYPPRQGGADLQFGGALPTGFHGISCQARVAASNTGPSRQTRR